MYNTTWLKWTLHTISNLKIINKIKWFGWNERKILVTSDPIIYQGFLRINLNWLKHFQQQFVQFVALLRIKMKTLSLSYLESSVNRHVSVIPNISQCLQWCCLLYLSNKYVSSTVQLLVQVSYVSSMIRNSGISVGTSGTAAETVFSLR